MLKTSDKMATFQKISYILSKEFKKSHDTGINCG